LLNGSRGGSDSLEIVERSLRPFDVRGGNARDVLLIAVGFVEQALSSNYRTLNFACRVIRRLRLSCGIRRRRRIAWWRLIG
jgi:hypothetical protein